MRRGELAGGKDDAGLTLEMILNDFLRNGTEGEMVVEICGRPCNGVTGTKWVLEEEIKGEAEGTSGEDVESCLRVCGEVRPGILVCANEDGGADWRGKADFGNLRSVRTGSVWR